MVLLQAGVYPRAEKEFRAVLDVEPQNDEATIGLAASLRGEGKRESQSPYLEAEKLLQSILDREPGQLSATFNLAVLYAELPREAGQGAAALSSASSATRRTSTPRVPSRRSS